MSTREIAAGVFDTLSEGQLLDFLRLFADDNTLAIVESDIIARSPDRKHYRSFNELLDEINGEPDDE